MKLKTHHPILHFSEEANTTRDSLSAAVFVGDSLWLASDESTSVERLLTTDGTNFGNHESFPLAKMITLPALGIDVDQEIDIEGMDVADSYLWLTGSHSVKRKNVDKSDPSPDEKLIKKLAKTEIDGNRFLIARVPVIRSDDQPPFIASPDPAHDRHASSLAGDTRSNALTTALSGDKHLGSFLEISGKDNGFDIEGMAVKGDKIFLGLRGPVLRGWAIVLELHIDDGPVLELKNFAGSDRPYRKHFLPLAGLGVRDLCVAGEDLLVLAGPTMVLDGPTRIYRWKNALHSSDDSIVREEDLTIALEVPFGAGTDHAEGIALVPKQEQVLVVYDSPSDERKVGPSSVRTDIFDLDT